MSKKPLLIDGDMGEGGGQILRTALSLSLCLQQPFRIINIRARRAKPGLQPQHLAAVMAAAEVGRAEVRGAERDSLELYFTPQGLFAGEYRFDIGTAGSTTLVLQTVLLPLLQADAPSHLILIGGTHNPWAPTYEFLQEAFLPLLRRMGARVGLELKRPGFYPCGGGELAVSIQPVKRLQPLQLQQCSEVNTIRALAQLAYLPRHIAERELAVLAQALPLETQQIQFLEGAYCPGNALHVGIEGSGWTEWFSAIGQRGVLAEEVASTLARKVRHFLAAGVPVGEHLADQLLLPLALAGGGSYFSVEPDRHTSTNSQVIQRFMDIPVAIERVDDRRWFIRLG